MGKFLSQPSTIKGIFALASAIAIYLKPEHGAEIAGGFLTVYGLFETGRNEDKRIKQVSEEEKGA